MLRIRLKSVALVLGVALTTAGCATNSCEGPSFPRLSNLFHRQSEPACECQTGQTGMLPPEFAGHGPVFTPPPPSTMPTVTTIPSNQPPLITKTPTAPTFPYVPAN